MKSAAFPERRRLTNGRDYRRVFAARRRSTGRFFILGNAANDGQEARLGLAVAKRHCKRAVDRNRIKRVIREWFRTRAAQFPATDLVCSVRPSVVTASNEALFADLEKLGAQAAAESAARAPYRTTN